MKNYIFITRDGAPLSIADRLKDEGKNVYIGMTEDDTDAKAPKEKNAARLSLYDGILEKTDAENLLDWMEGLPNKDEFFVMFDYGDLWPYSERVLDMGFSKGVFPTEDGYDLERDRTAGKKFAEEHYPSLKVAPVHEFKKVQDAIKLLNETKDKIFVLKSEGSNAETVVPTTMDFDLGRRQIIGALQTETKGYEKEGFTLEEKIVNPIELSPVMVFWEGKPLFSLIELENKPIGSGNIGRLSGGCQNLSIQTPLNCALNKIAFPPVIFEMAKKQPGVGIYDAGLLFDGKEFYFTEFCSQRWGWDGIFSEIAMSADRAHKNAASRHFDGLADGKNPLTWKFGAAVRLFQTEPNEKHPDMYQDGYAIDWLDEQSDNLFFYALKKAAKEGGDEKQFVSVGVEKDLGVAIGAGDFTRDAINGAYAAAEGVAMTGLYYRPKFDFNSKDYFASISNRLDFLHNSGLIA